jgi:hypothetical protein
MISIYITVKECIIEGPLLAVRNCLFNIFIAALHIWRLYPPFATQGCAIPCHGDGDPCNMALQIYDKIKKKRRET